MVYRTLLVPVVQIEIIIKIPTSKRQQWWCRHSRRYSRCCTADISAIFFYQNRDDNEIVKNFTTMNVRDMIYEQECLIAKNSLNESLERSGGGSNSSGSGAPTDDSLSDETALDISQNSSESGAKCQSDLESCSVSSIRKINDRAICDSLMNVDMSARRVSFPKKDSDLVTGYLEPANPWKSVAGIKTSFELTVLYKSSCLKHKSEPLKSVLDHLQSLDIDKAVRQNCLSLKGNYLTPESCEALEEILKRVQYQTIDLTACNLNDAAASAIFDMIEYYEATNELNIADNPEISANGWQSFVGMIRRSRALQSIIIRGNAISDSYAINLGKALNHSNLHTIKLEHCGLTGRPLAFLCNALRKNTTLRELWVAHNDLYYFDADKLADLLKVNAHLQFLDVSNNNLKDEGIKSIAIALIDQAARLSTFLDSEEKPKLDSVDSACTDIANDTKAIKIQFENDEPATPQSDDSITIKNPANGSRSMLDALLQMKPGECLEPVQRTGNNNEYKELIEEITYNKIDDDCSSNNESSSTVDQITDVADSAPNELNIIETNNENATTTDTNLILDQHDDQQTNNNTLENENTKNDLFPVEPDTEESLKTLDLNENNEDNGCCKPLLFDSVDDGTNKESLEQTPNNSPILMEKPEEIIENISHQKEQHEAYTTRSQSSDSLSSDNSFDSNLSPEVKEKITKNDTLGRQKSNPNENLVDVYKAPRGLQALILWNNNFSRVSGEYISDMLATTNSLELLNIGKNILSNDFIERIGNSLKSNRTLTNLGLQSSHLTSVGIKKLAEILHFGGNITLQRIDIRDNNVQVDGLLALCDVLKSNKTVTRIDIDDEPKRLQDDSDCKFNYSKNLHTIRTLCQRNQTPLAIPAVRSSRKISLTCQSIHTLGLRNDNLDVKKKSGVRLRSPLPSPPTVSPSSSPVPSPSRGSSRFHVSRVLENGKGASVRLESTIPTSKTRTANICSSPNSRFHVTIVNTDLDENKDFRKPIGHDPKPIADMADGSDPSKTSTSEIQFVFPEIGGKEPINKIVLTPSSPPPPPPPILSTPNISNCLEIVETATVDNGANTKVKSKTETRVRKSSWNTNYPTVDKLFSFIQQSSTIFNRSCSNESDKKADTDDTKNVADALRHSTNIDEHRTQITTSADPIRENYPSKSQSFFDAATKQLKEFKDFGKHVLKQNTPIQHQLPPQQLPSSAAILIDDTTTTDIIDTHPKECELIPSNIKLEIKENISPKHSFSSNHSNAVYNEIANPDKILKLENQVVVIGEKVTNSETPLATQDDDIHEI